MQLKPTYTSGGLINYLTEIVGVPIEEIHAVIRNPNVVEGFYFKVEKVATSITVYESFDHDGMNDDEVQVNITVSYFNTVKRQILIEKIRI